MSNCSGCTKFYHRTRVCSVNGFCVDGFNTEEGCPLNLTPVVDMSTLQAVMQEPMNRKCQEIAAKVIPNSGLKDSGNRVTFAGGGVREPKPERFDLMSIVALYSEARQYSNGAVKYAPRNWQKGLKFTTCVNAIMRHTLKYILFGCSDEDHLSAIRWNAAALKEYEVTHPELNDLAWGNNSDNALPADVREKLHQWLSDLEKTEGQG
jgi:hypothetical protein